MSQNTALIADLVTFTEEILNGKLHFLCSVLPVKLRNKQEYTKIRKKKEFRHALHSACQVLSGFISL